MTHYLVYKIRNKINNRIYIGAHLTNNLNDGYLGSGVVMKRAINKHGVENFEKTILFDYDNKEDMLRMERILVDEYFVGQPDTYNLRRGGMGGQSFGHIVTNVTREKISKARIGKKFSDETKQKLSEGHKGQGLGRVVSFEIREKISKANKGKIRTEDIKQNLKVPHIKLRGRKLTEEHKEKIRNANRKAWANPELRKNLGQSRLGNQWSKGTKWTQEQKDYLSKVKTGVKGPKQSETAKFKRGLAISMTNSMKKGNIARVLDLQEKYFLAFGCYNQKYIIPDEID